MTFLLDTNVAVAIIRNNPKIVRDRLKAELEAGASVAISTIAVYELWYGAAKSARPDENARLLDAFLSGEVVVLPFDAEAAAIAGQIRAKLKLLGTQIGPYDLLIAGQALAANATLVTANKSEFSRVDGLTWEDWSIIGEDWP